MELLELLFEKAVKNNRRVVLPEGEAPQIVEAAFHASRQGICRPILLGNKDKIREICLQHDIPEVGWYVSIDPESVDLEESSMEMASCSGMDPVTTHFLLEQPLYYAAMMVRTGQADAMVAGFIADTAEVITAGRMFVGLKEGAPFASSYFIMDIPGLQNEEGGMLVYTDAGVIIDPDAEQLAQIAIQTSDTVSHLLGWEPRVAMLSFSTKGSASHAKVDKVLDACSIAHRLAPELLLDGELQGDAALSPQVAAKKVPGGSPVAGRANILVFPDLDAGNIAYKLTQRLTGGRAYGPLLQGFALPVCDLSRGSSVEDILGIIAVAAAQ